MDFEKLKEQAADLLKAGDTAGAGRIYNAIIAAKDEAHLADAYFGKLMIEKGVRADLELRVKCIDELIRIKDSPNYMEAYKHADAEFRFFLFDLSQQIENAITKGVRQTKQEELIYHDSGVDDRLNADRKRREELARKRKLGEEAAQALKDKKHAALVRKSRAVLLAGIGAAALFCIVTIGIPTARYSGAMGAVRNIDSGKSQGAAIQHLMSIDGYKDSGDILATFFYNPVAAGDSHSIMMKTASASASAGKGNPRTSAAREAIGGFFDMVDAVDAAGSGDLSKLEEIGEKQTNGKTSEAEDVFGAAGTMINGVSEDGKVAAVGDNSGGQCRIGTFSNVVSIAAGSKHTVGLKADGFVTAVGNNAFGQCDVTKWTDIVSVAAGGNVTVGVTKKGRCVAAGQNTMSQTDVDDWKNVVAAATGGNHTVGLMKNGKVAAAGSDSAGQTDVSGWKNIVAVAAGSNHTVGLKADGTAVAAGDNAKGQCDVKQWSNITAVAAGGDFTAGLKYDGTLVVTGDNSLNQINVNALKGSSPIVALAAGKNNLIVMRQDGTYEALGDNSKGQLAVG